MEADATGKAARTHGPGVGLEGPVRPDLEAVKAIEAVALSPIVGEQHDPRVALPAVRVPVSSLRNLASVRPELPRDGIRPPDP
jgi:hypothetical protein